MEKKLQEKPTKDFNKAIRYGKLALPAGGQQKLALHLYLLITVDELADLMTPSAHETEENRGLMS